MAILSKIHQGLQRPGRTRLDSSILVEQTGPMEITVRAGDWVAENGDVFTLLSDQVHAIPSDPDYDTFIVIELTNPSSPTTELLT